MMIPRLALRGILMVLLVQNGLSARTLFAQPAPLHRAHAHNDYEHPRPLLDALERGFTSIEVDIHLHEGRLLVGHDPEDLTPERTLEALYLDPLMERYRADGRLYADRTPLQLLVDVKTDAEATYAALEPVLARYHLMLSRYVNGEIHAGAVTVVVSGNRARGTMADQTRRYAFFDGRLEDLGTGAPASLMPLVSASWRSIAPPLAGVPGREVRRAVRKQVQTAHAEGKTLRFWATPEDPELWAFLYEAGVDYLNTDRLDEMKAFLQAR